ncbi:MAG TPA: protein kinase [Bryobacteraceae bacterium]|nr:protein kinase [Bryobacteraceae bacterium]
MPLSAGDKLGPYEILSPIGTGGMGEVWKARDTRIDRIVAIKLSKDQFTERFEREVRTVAALNHPNICTLFDVGPNYLVMEYIEGPTLAELIKEGPVPIEQATAIALQIAEAFEEAHDKNIVHRDLKPANVKVTPEGRVKVLDFGLAKTLEVAPAFRPESPDNSPTMTLGMTALGTILGTAAYMAPEQARGKAVDKRADIWAFGATLFEMFSGRRAFPGEDSTDILAAVVKLEPDWNALPADVPWNVRRVVRHCLVKDRRNRLREITDARIELSNPVENGAATTVKEVRVEVPVEVKVEVPVKVPSKWGWIAAGAAAAAALALSAVHFREKPPEAPVVRTSILPPEESSGFVLDANTGGTAISPDGRLLAFVASVKGKSSLFVRPLDSLIARALPGTEGAARPFWSPDSRNIGFQANGKLQRIGVNEGAPRVVCDLTQARGATWNADGVIIFNSRTNQALNRVAASGGAPQPLTVLDEKAERFHYWPQFLPDGKHFLYLIRAQPLTQSAVYVGSLDDKPEEKKRVKLVDSQLGAIFVPNPSTPGEGHLLWVQGQSLMAQAFNPDTLKLSGDAVPVAELIGETEANGYADLSASQTGVLAYGNSRQSSYRLTWIDRTGKRSEPFAEAALSVLRISPDGNSVMVRHASPAVDLWRVDLLRNIQTRFTFSAGANPVWSADGRDVVFVNGSGVFRKAASGAGEPVELLKRSGNTIPLDWSEDGKWLLYRQLSTAGAEVWAAPMEAAGKVGKPFVFVHVAVLGRARFSPGATGQRWLAYQSDESGQPQVYIQDFPDKHGKWQVSTTGGGSPVWNRNGRELFYETEGGQDDGGRGESEWGGFVPGTTRASVRPPLCDGVRRQPGRQAFPGAAPARPGPPPGFHHDSGKLAVGVRPVTLLVAMHGTRRERGHAYSDILSARFPRRAVANPLALVRNDGLTGLNFQHTRAGLDSQRPPQNHRVLVELRRLPRLLPAGGTGHVRNARRIGGGIHAADVLGDAFGLVARGLDDARL